MLVLDDTTGVLGRADAPLRFDPASRLWTQGPPVTGTPVSAVTAATWLQRQSGHRLRAPIGVIGPRQASPEQLAAAEAVGAACARMGFVVVCGGRQGVMEAVCRGAAAANGVSIGLLPETDTQLANPYVTISLATGIGEARNVLVARAAFCLVAIGNSYGTLSEVALGLQFGRPVYGLCGAAEVEGVRQMPNVEAAADAVARAALSLDAQD